MTVIIQILKMKMDTIGFFQIRFCIYRLTGFHNHFVTGVYILLCLQNVLRKCHQEIEGDHNQGFLYIVYCIVLLNIFFNLVCLIITRAFCSFDLSCPTLEHLYIVYCIVLLNIFLTLFVSIVTRAATTFGLRGST